MYSSHRTRSTVYGDSFMKTILTIFLILISCISHGQTKPHWLNIKGTPVVDVRTFGAKGDGQTDDTAAIAAAIAAASVNGGTVFFAKGTYLTGPILIVEDHVSLVGEGMGVSTLLLKAPRVGTHYNLIGIGTTGNPAHHCSLKDITLDGNRDAQAYEEWSVGVMITESDYWHMSNVEVTDTIGYRVWVGYLSTNSAQGSNYGLMENCLIQANPNGATVALVGGCYNVFRNNRIGGTFDAENNPEQLGLVNYNVVDGNRGTIDVTDGPASTTSNLSIAFVSYIPAGVTPAPRQIGNVITNNQINSFISNNAADMVVSNNIIVGSSSIALVQLDDITSSTFSNNILTDTSGSSIGAMVRTRGGTGLKVSDNVVNNGSKIFHSNFGFWSEAYATATQVLFTNNIITGTGPYRQNNTSPLFPSEKARIKVESLPGNVSQTVTLISGNLRNLPVVYRYKAVDGHLGANNWLITTPSGASLWYMSVLPLGALDVATTTLDTFILGKQSIRPSNAGQKVLDLYNNTSGTPTRILADSATCTFFLDIEY